MHGRQHGRLTRSYADGHHAYAKRVRIRICRETLHGVYEPLRMLQPGITQMLPTDSLGDVSHGSSMAPIAVAQAALADVHQTCLKSARHVVYQRKLPLASKFTETSGIIYKLYCT